MGLAVALGQDGWPAGPRGRLSCLPPGRATHLSVPIRLAWARPPSLGGVPGEASVQNSREVTSHVPLVRASRKARLDSRVRETAPASYGRSSCGIRRSGYREVVLRHFRKLCVSDSNSNYYFDGPSKGCIVCCLSV